jgi:hypothetical protein
MKPIHFLPPAVATAIAIAWIAYPYRSIAILDQQSTLLEKHLATAESEPDAVTTRRKLASDLAKGPIDWKQFAAAFDELNSTNGLGDRRLLERFDKRVMEMSIDELNAAMDEIAALDLSDGIRRSLESRLLSRLARLAPEATLQKFIGRLSDNGGNAILTDAFKNWAEKDPAATAAWLDREIAAGRFDSRSLDGKSQTRMEFEGALIAALLPKDLRAATSRLASLPPDQRDDALRAYPLMFYFSEKNHVAYAKLVREQLPQDDQASAISRLIANRASNLDVVAQYLQRIEATSNERGACVEYAALAKLHSVCSKGKVTRVEVDNFREWANSQAPQSTDKATGKAFALVLAQQQSQTSFADLAALADQYHDEGAGDDILLPMLESPQALQHKEEARTLAGKVSDEKRRNELLEKLK